MSSTAAITVEEEEFKPDSHTGQIQSRVGLLPADWEVRRIDEIATVVRGSSPRPAGDPRYFDGSFVPWLTVAALTNIPDWKLTVTETATCLTEQGSRLSRTLDPGIVIVANSGATLGVAKILGIKCCANDGIAALLAQLQGDERFVCYYLNTLTTYLREVVAPGNGQPNLNTTLIGNIKIPQPPVGEQRAIAAALSNVDVLIGALDKLIAKKRTIKLATMQQLLTGRSRLPGFAAAWKSRNLDDVAKVVMGQSPSGASYNSVESGIPLINGPTEFTDRYPIPAQWTTEPTKLCEPGDMLLCVRGSSTGRINIADDVYCIGRGICAIRAKAGSTTSFITYHVDSAIQEVLRFTTGSTFPNIDGKSIRSIRVPVPDEVEQNAIVSVLFDMDAELTALERNRDKTKAIKRGMMQQLLTGRIRLVKPETSA